MGAYNTNDKAKDTARKVLGGPTQRAPAKGVH